MAFRLVTRRGAKQQTRELIVPASSRLAISSRKKDDAEREEKQALKRIVLDYEEARASTEDSSGGLVRQGMRVLNKGGLLFSNSGARGRGMARGGRHGGGGRGEGRSRPLPGVEEQWQE
jgi:regulator of nonsense transcripts 2